MDLHQATETKRDYRIDSVKFGLIVLVVTGHVMERQSYDSMTGVAPLWNLIYIFHMPLFVFISGYFSKKKDMGHFWPSLRRLIEPLILFQIFWLTRLYLTRGIFSVEALLTPQLGLWYLLCLIYWRCMLQCLPDKLLHNKPLLIVGSFVISILVGFLPFGPLLSLQRTFSFLPFFFLGYCMQGKNLFLGARYRVWSFLFLATLFYLLSYIEDILGVLCHAVPYSDIYGMYVRMFAFILSISTSLAFLNLCPSHPWLAEQGKYTLPYYLYHNIVILAVMKVVKRFDFYSTLFTALIIAAVVVLLLFLLVRIPFFRKVTTPSALFRG